MKIMARLELEYIESAIKGFARQGATQDEIFDAVRVSLSRYSPRNVKAAIRLITKELQNQLKP